MTATERATTPQVARVKGGGGFQRLAALGALALVILAILVMLLSGGSSHNYRLLFESGGQLVKGNQVLIGGAPVGSVDDVKLTNDGKAQVDISVDRVLHQGTSAVIRATSLSGIANRYVSLEPGPNNAPELTNGSTITEVDTTAPVDLDQLFNTFRPQERKALQDIIKGSATVYAGANYENGVFTGAGEANQTYKYLSPALVQTDRLLAELDRDSRVLTQFLVNGASVVTAVGERRNDLSNLVSNANEALGAIASQNQALDRSLVALPPALRQANTTFHNLRPALDDLTPLVNTSKTATKNLAPFLSQLERVVKKSIPVLQDLQPALNRKGKSNDLADAAADLAPLEAQASTAIPATVAAMQSGDHVLRFLRPYAPDITATLGGLARASGYYDADGHYLRASPAAMDVFNYTGGAPPNLVPLPVSQIFSSFGAFGTANNQVMRRCPGAATQPIGGSNPFSAPPFPGPPIGAPTTPGDCDATDVPPGP